MSSNDEHNCIDDDKIVEDIEKFGWSVLIIEASDYLPGFAYTIGLWKSYNHPEIIAFGLSSQTLHAILNIGGEIAKSGQELLSNVSYSDFFENGSAQFLKVDDQNIGDYFGYAIGFYQREDFPALQLVWSDRNNIFPWELNYEKEFEHKQPLLDRNASFKFREAKNVAIFTTRQWIELNKPILRVIHDHGGDWQFLTGDQMPEDIRVVALEEMTLRDSTLNEIFNLDYGEEAERESIGGKWIRNDVEFDGDE